MSILTKPEILKAIKRGRIAIDPYDPSAVGPGSIDLTLDDKFRVFKRLKTVHDAKKTDYKDITKLVKRKTIVVRPGETILGITLEKVTLASDLCGWLEGRTRFARLGLLIHISASFMQPGISNKQVLEISNMGHTPLRLEAGMRICQFVFQKTVGKAKYQGQFKAQTEP
ncbi:MAG: dCTP deaminase [Nanoarchaeota archaeon]